MENEARTPKKRIVGIGSVCVGSENSEFVAYAIGSCIALCLYEPCAKVGAMAHILLPSASYSKHENSSDNLSTKYADHALCLALEQMINIGADKEKIKAAIIGGAEMFPHGCVTILNIGQMNTASVIEELEKNKIPLVYSDVGGKQSRTVFFRIPGNNIEKQITVKKTQGLL